MSRPSKDEVHGNLYANDRDKAYDDGLSGKMNNRDGFGCQAWFEYDALYGSAREGVLARAWYQGIIDGGHLKKLRERWG